MQANIYKIQKSDIHNGPGKRTVIYFKGCPLRCVWCSHPSSSGRPSQILWNSKKCFYCHLCEKNCPTHSLRFHNNQLNFNAATCNGCNLCISECPGRGLQPVGELLELEETMNLIRENQEEYRATGGGITLSGGDAVSQPKFATALLKACRAEGIHTAVATTAFTSAIVFSRMMAYTDLLLFDLKHYDSRLHVQYTGASNQSILENLDLAVSAGIPVIARILLIPGVNNSLYDAGRFAHLLREHRVTQAELIPFHHFGQKKCEEPHLPPAIKGMSTLRPAELADYAKKLEELGISVQLAH